MRRGWAVLVAVVALAGCGGGGGGAPDAGGFVPEVGAPDVPVEPDVPVAPDVPVVPDVPLECADDTIFVPALDECYPLAGEPGTECVEDATFVLSFSSNPAFTVADQPEPVVEWAELVGTVTVALLDQLHVEGEGGVVYQFQWANPTRFGRPWEVGDAVRLEWIGVTNPYDPLIPRHGLKVTDAIGRLMFLVDDGKGDLPGPIWEHAPGGGGMEGFSVAREPVGCPVDQDPPGREGELALPTALRFRHTSGAEVLVLPGAEGQLTVDGQLFIMMNAVAERRVGEEDTGRERMAWLLLAPRATIPVIPPGQRGGPCPAEGECQDSQCADWPGGARLCL